MAEAVMERTTGDENLRIGACNTMGSSYKKTKESRPCQSHHTWKCQTLYHIIPLLQVRRGNYEFDILNFTQERNVHGNAPVAHAFADGYGSNDRNGLLTVHTVGTID